MESFLKDTTLETDETSQEFHPFLKQDETNDPAVEGEADASLETGAETLPESPEGEPAEAGGLEQEEGSVEGEETAEPETGSSPEATTPAPENSDQLPEGLDQEPEPATPVSSESEQASEVVFEQVEGPKVEVVYEGDAVTRIVVHLAPDKILELKCEY